jgi:hypothetical protein
VELGVPGEVVVGDGSGVDVEHALHDTAPRRVGFRRA